VDLAGNVYLTGYTYSAGWVSQGWDTSHNGGYDAFLLIADSSGRHLCSSYLGGALDDRGRGLAMDVMGSFYLCGITASEGWLSEGWDVTYGGGKDGFLARIGGNSTTGNLRITLTPSSAVNAGAQWRRKGTSTWFNSGDTESGVPAGNWTIQFAPVDQFTKPVLTATVIAGQTTDLSAAYTPWGPGLVWGSYLGGSSDDWGEGIAVDDAGSVYATGWTGSSGWVSGGWDPSYNGGLHDVFVVKLTDTGQHVWSTYLGGVQPDYGWGIALDDEGSIVVSGVTASSGWVSGGWDTEFGGGKYDGFVAKLNPEGQHQWSTYLGAEGPEDRCLNIGTDATGHIYATGWTDSSGWISGGWDTTYGGQGDGFIIALNSLGAHLWSTYVGGAQPDFGEGIVVHETGRVYATGHSESPGCASGGWDTTHNGAFDAYALKLSPAGVHKWSSYVGGAAEERGYTVTLDGYEDLYLSGDTLSSGWTSGGWDTSWNGGYDGFLLKLTSSGVHLWSSYSGGPGDDHSWGMSTDGDGNLYATGFTSSDGWVSGGWDTTHNGGKDAYILKIGASGLHLWSSYLGGAGDDLGQGIAVDAGGNVHAAGYTTSPGWLRLGWDISHNGSYDAYVVRIEGIVGPKTAARQWRWYR